MSETPEVRGFTLEDEDACRWLVANYEGQTRKKVSVSQFSYAITNTRLESLNPDTNSRDSFIKNMAAELGEDSEEFTAFAKDKRDRGLF